MARSSTGTVFGRAERATMRLLALAALVVFGCIAAAPEPALVPAPSSIVTQPACRPLPLTRALAFEPSVDPGAFEVITERWRALGISAPRRVPAHAPASVTTTAGAAPPGGYALEVCGSAVRLHAATSEARFDALMTLAQLPVRSGGRWTLPAVRITDRPALPWRIVSDDVSRGPFPTTAYAHRRIRTLAALKINGWSPYMEQVVRDPRYPYVAMPDGWTAEQLHELSVYARRFHVTLIPEQQTFAHLHEALKWETLAPLAELPHGYLVAESDPRTYAYLGPLVRSVAQAVAPVPFVHLGSDEPLDLGRGRTPRSAEVVGAHVTRVAAFLDGRARPMIWDDAIQADRTILARIPRDTVIVSFHYGLEPSYAGYVRTVADAGFDQMIAPGAANWNEVYPDLATTYTNTSRFLGDARGARGLLGMFFTVWHDDGESLFEATWPAVAYAAASAWQAAPPDPQTWHATFTRAFFGSDDPQYAADLDALRAIRPLLRTSPSDPPDYLFWHDPFDPRLQARAATMDLAQVRTLAEGVLGHVTQATPPLNASAAQAMRLGALRYDVVARRLQIGREAHDYYDDARAHATKPGENHVYRSLGVAKYLCWELRDALASLQPIYAGVWRTENTAGGLPRVLAKYTLAEGDAQRCADRIDAVTREDYLRSATVPPWEQLAL